LNCGVAAAGAGAAQPAEHNADGERGERGGGAESLQIERLAYRYKLVGISRNHVVPVGKIRRGVIGSEGNFGRDVGVYVNDATGDSGCDDSVREDYRDNSPSSFAIAKWPAHLVASFLDGDKK
jgi:hypothetical protein